MLVRRAVVAFRQRRALARFALARRRVAAGDATLERTVLDLLFDEPDGGVARCRATTRKGKPCQRTPLPERDYCPSHQHLETRAAA